MQSSRVLVECAAAAAAGAALGAYAALHTELDASVARGAVVISVLCLMLLLTFARQTVRARRILFWSLSFSSLFAAASSAGFASKQAELPPEFFAAPYRVQGHVDDGCRPSAPPCSFSAILRIVPDPNADAAYQAMRQSVRVRIYLREGAWAPLPGDQFQVRGRFRREQGALHPYAFDAQTWSKRQGFDASFQMDATPEITGIRTTLPRRIALHRARMEYAMRRHGREEAAGILVAMSTGTKSGLSQDVRARFAASGTAHVLAVSGLHLGLLAGALWWALSKIFQCFPPLLRRWNSDALSACVTLPVLALYVLFTGLPTSAMRAGFMAAALLLPRIATRRGSSLHGLSLAILLLISTQPLLIAELGFQLSVAATLSLVLLARQSSQSAPDEAPKESREEEVSTLLAFRFGDADAGRGLDPRSAENAHTEEVPDSRSSAPRLRPAPAMEAHPTSSASTLESPSPPPRNAWHNDLALLIGFTAQADDNGEPSRVRRMLLWLWAAIEVSIVSTIATAPFLVWHFGGLPLLSPLPNLLIVPPLSILALPLGAIGAAIDGISPTVGGIFVQWALQIIDLCLALARGGEKIFEVEVLLGRPHLLGVVGWALLALASPFLSRSWQGRWWLLAATGVLFVGMDLQLRRPHGDHLEIHAIPVGQGDATWIRFPGGRSMLIDAGGHGFGVSRTGTQYVLPYLRAHGVKHVDILVATHGDADHIAGITELVPLLRPSDVWTGNNDFRRQMEVDLYLAAKKANARYTQPHFVWQEVRLGETTLEILPVDGLDSSNDGGLTMRLCYRDFCALLTGDIEARREAFLVKHGLPLQAQYLKVGHHGSRTSTGSAFLQRVAPQVAVIHLAEGNRFGFPRPEVMDRLQAAGIDTWRTDRGESIVHVSDGHALWRLRRHQLPRFRKRKPPA